MTATGVPESVREFVAKHIESVAQLEVLLLLRAAGDKEWTPQEVSAALVIQPETAAASWLTELERRGLAGERNGAYRYDPPEQERPTLDALAESYATDRVALVALIFSKPGQRITHLADAFTAGAGSDRRVSLFWRVFLIDAAVVLVAWGLLALSPVALELPVVLWGGLVSVVGLLALLTVNLFLLRRAFSPLARLTAMMPQVDPLRPGPRLPIYGAGTEVVELTRAFNDMLERLEHERRESAIRVLREQEGERHRLARELHDEIGQRLTAVLLQLEHSSRRLPPESARELNEARETARASLDEVRRVLARLRPAALEDLGLASALRQLGDQMTGESDARLVLDVGPELPRLSPEVELVVYRVAQEAVTNAIRHSQGSVIELRLASTAKGLRLTVTDDGRGMDGTGEGGGIRGLRERALLIGASLELRAGPRDGLEVRLDVPVEHG